MSEAIGNSYGEKMDLKRLATAMDLYRDYFNFRNNAPGSNQLVSVDDFPPEEQVFGAEEVIKIHSFATDPPGRYWLLKDREKDPVFKDDNVKELPYELGTLAGVGVIEDRVLEVDGELRWASRFLPNAVSGKYLGSEDIPEHIRTNVQKNVSALWPFNFFAGLKGDVEYVFTAEGNVAIVDSKPTELVDGFHYKSLPDEINDPWDVIEFLDVDFQKYALSEYFCIGAQSLPLDKDVVMATIEAIESIKDIDLENIVSEFPQSRATRFGQEIEGYRQKAYEALIWKRDHIREIFQDVQSD